VGLEPQLIIGCRWYALLLTRTVITQLALCEIWGGALAVVSRRLIAVAWRLLVEVGWRRCCSVRLLECCCLLRLARWGVQFSEDRWSQGVSWSGWLRVLTLRRPAPVAGYIATSRTCHANTRNSLLEMYLPTGPRHLADWSVFYGYFCCCLETNPI
jgi:hypothetical protein